MATTFHIYLKSGQEGAVTYTNGDNVSLIEITNSDQDYYQNGVIQLFDITDTFNINDTAMIFIDNILQFNGYIARKEQTIDSGKLNYIYQIVGKTYDLWRHVTNSTTEYSGQTGFIASSLVADFCPGISGGSTWYNSGVNFSESVDFSNTVIGEAMIRLTESDGYNFYVDEMGQLHYYKPKTRAYDFTITESDIINMSPIEEADDDIINDVLIIGGSDYSHKTQVASNHPSSLAIPDNTMIAQQFTAEDDRLASVKLYLDRTEGDDKPTDGISFEVWQGANQDLFTDTFDDYSKLDQNFNYGTQVLNGSLILSYTSSHTHSFEKDDGTLQITYAAQTFRFPYNYTINYAMCKMQTSHSDPLVAIICPTSNAAGSIYPDHTQYLTSGSKSNITQGSNTIYFNKPFTMISGTTYAVLFGRDWGIREDPVNRLSIRRDHQYVTPIYNKGKMWFFDGDDWINQDSGDDTYDLWFKINGVKYAKTGSILSKKYVYDCQYMKLDWDASVSGDRIYISGTNSGAAHMMSSLSDNTWEKFAFEYSAVRVKYILSSNGTYTPKLNSAQLTIGDAAGSSSGLPASGTKLEWSDDISFYATDVPYNPEWSSWKNYTDPKLVTTDNATYWFILQHASGSNKYYSYYYNPKSTYGKMVYSTDNGVSWMTHSSNPTVVPDGDMSFQLGWKEGEITARASSSESINAYGRHFRKITDSTITTQEVANARAQAEISGSEIINKKGNITINGRTDMDVNYRFSSNLSNFGINEMWDVMSYTQRITPEEGFVTEINYGKQPYDIVAELEKLKGKVYSEE